MEQKSPQAEQPTPAKKQNTGMAVIAYILFFVPLLTDAKNDPYVKFHVKQGLVLFIAWILISVVQWILPSALFFVNWVLSIGAFVLLVKGILNALNGKQEPLPLIGQYADKINI